MKKFPSIEQYKHVIRHVKYSSTYRGQDDTGSPIHDWAAPLPTLTFEGTVKLHGTNAGITFNPDGTYYCQGRNRILALGNDNMGFALYVHGSKIHETLKKIIDDNGLDCSTVTVYGEWCGEGIQKNIAISSLPKMFVIFAIRVEESADVVKWYLPKELIFDSDKEKLSEEKCYLIDSFKTFKMTIDFNRPELVQNDIIDITLGVEEQCPVGEALKATENTVGEGVVWRCISDGYSGSEFWFKVKGEKHSVSKVKTLAEVDVAKVNSVIEFAENVVTQNRLEQGISYLKEMGIEISIKTTGDFIRWVYNDILKEEADVIHASGLNVKDLGKYIGSPAKRWYFKYLETNNV